VALREGGGESEGELGELRELGEFAEFELFLPLLLLLLLLLLSFTLTLFEVASFAETLSETFEAPCINVVFDAVVVI
jgi:hypothetical protein